MFQNQREKFFEMFACEICSKEFQSNSGLLRHVSHQTICRNYYGENKLADMRTEARLESRRKWNKKQAVHESKRYEIERDKRKEKSRQRYVNSTVRKRSQEGEAFKDFLNHIFNECMTDIGKNRLFERSHEVMHDRVYEKAIDHAMGSQAYIGIFWKNVNHFHGEEITYEDRIEEELGIALEAAFDKFYDDNIGKEQNQWTHCKERFIYIKVSSQCERTAFANHFEEFKSTIYNDAMTKAMDTAFEKEFEEDISDWNLELGLKKSFKETFDNELEKASVESNISKIITKRIMKAMNKQVRILFKELDETK